MNTSLYRIPTSRSAPPASPPLGQPRRRSLLASLGAWAPFHRQPSPVSLCLKKSDISHPLPDPQVNYIARYSGELQNVQSHGGAFRSKVGRRARVVGTSLSSWEESFPTLPIHHRSNSVHLPRSTSTGRSIRRLSLPAVVRASSTPPSPRSHRTSHFFDKNPPPVPPVHPMYKASLLPPLPCHTNVGAADGHRHHPCISAPLIFPLPPYRPPPSRSNHQRSRSNSYKEYFPTFSRPSFHHTTPTLNSTPNNSGRHSHSHSRSHSQSSQRRKGNKLEAMKGGINLSNGDLNNDSPFEFDGPEWKFGSSTTTTSSSSWSEEEGFPSTPELDQVGCDDVFEEEGEEGVKKAEGFDSLWQSIAREETIWIATMGIEDRCEWEGGLGACHILDLYLD